MAEIIHLNQAEVNMADKFAGLVRDGKVTQGIVCYRLDDGDINYMLFSPEHLTYILGMMERIKTNMCLEGFE